MLSREGLVVEDDSKRRSELRARENTNEKRLYDEIKNKMVSWVLNYLTTKTNAYSVSCGFESIYYRFYYYIWKTYLR